MDEQTRQEIVTQDEELKALQARAAALRPKYPEKTFVEFLETVPPDTHVCLVDLGLLRTNSDYIATPDISSYCAGDKCKGQRRFVDDGRISGGGSISTEKAKRQSVFLTFRCRNCSTQTIRFAISLSINSAPNGGSKGTATAVKLGQEPQFGPQLPSRLISLIGPDRELFLQGVRAENRGMGIGAFAYYRRVVENQKNRVIAEIAKVAKAIGSTPEVQELFNKAVNETRFSESLNMVKDVIPQALLIKGQNPLALLHTALSRGLHNPEMTDEHCLALAQSIRTILTELAERASQALKEDKEIQSALSVLMAVPRGEISLE